MGYTSRDFMDAERDNTGRIILYREGLFRKAYECSAYALCTQVHPLKTTKRFLKVVGGEMVSVGFPQSGDAKFIGGLERMEETEDRLVLKAPAPIDPQEFEAWKEALPLQPPRAAPKAPAPASAPKEGGSDGGERKEGEATAVMPAERVVAERLRLFDLAGRTPMECMLFVAELKKRLAGG
ncbi:MAG: hypothetical protein HUK10_16990 [Bacteroides heparinolyticus]|nr:hypothetical protein [Bacteroides heparinolyticus]